MNYVVTGSAGFIGSHIAEYLIDHGHDVTVVDNMATGNMGNIQQLRDTPHFHFVQGSITDSGLLKDTFKNAQGIFHQAAIPSIPRSIKDPVATNEVNVNGTLPGARGGEGVRGEEGGVCVPGIRRHAEPAGESGKNSLSKLQIQEIRKKSL